eukprot:scaffold17306_cov113-Skeletonema_dohrnii-CCMP3373.AAC.1
MMKKLKEDVGHDGLKDIHKCIMERMETDKAWKAEAKWHNKNNFEETMTLFPKQRELRAERNAKK